MRNLRTKCAQALATMFGLDTASLSPFIIDNAILQRMCASKCDAAMYGLRIADIEELTSLHQLLLVSESWFYREMDGVEAALSALQNHSSALTILSVPCARGEEPISVFDRAVMLGFNPELISAHGYDASESAIGIANSFCHPAYSYRGVSESFVARLFIDDRGEKFLKPHYRKSFCFETANVLAIDWLPKLPTYDLILCRNLLIYLDPAAQRNLIEKLGSFLSTNGLLVLGAAEGALARTASLENIKTSPVVFRRSGVAARTREQEVHGERLAKAKVVKSTRTQPGREVTVHQPNYQQTATPSVRPIEALAEEGRREEAYRAALEFVEDHPNDAKVHALLAVLSVSFGQFAQAHHWIVQAISLSPNEDEIIRYLDSVQCGEGQ